jgi:hypothetical protein
MPAGEVWGGREAGSKRGGHSEEGRKEVEVVARHRGKGSRLCEKMVWAAWMRRRAASLFSPSSCSCVWKSTLQQESRTASENIPLAFFMLQGMPEAGGARKRTDRKTTSAQV